MMSDRETLVKIRSIMRRLLLVPMDGLNPIPRKGVTKRECYRALFEIQELLNIRSAPLYLPPLTRGAFLLGMSQEELAEYLTRELADGVPGDCGSLVLPRAEADVLTVKLYADNICVEELTRIVDREDRLRRAWRLP